MLTVYVYVYVITVYVRNHVRSYNYVAMYVGLCILYFSGKEELTAMADCQSI